MRAAVAALVLLMTVAVASFSLDRLLLAAGSLALGVLLAIGAWLCARDRQLPTPLFAAAIVAAIFFLSVVSREQGMLGALSCLVALPACYVLLPERRAWAANGAILAQGLIAAGIVLERTVAARVAVVLVALSVVAAAFVRVTDIRRRRREARAALDPLTGVANRLRLRAALAEAVERSHRTEAQMTLVALDLDHFASINDRLGRDAGDAILRGVGTLLRQQVRSVDQVFRPGDDEFLVLLDGVDVLNGRDLAEQLRTAVAGHQLVSDGPVTVSVGVAGLLPREDAPAWMRRAGERLRDAKARGRNQVVA